MVSSVRELIELGVGETSREVRSEADALFAELLTCCEVIMVHSSSSYGLFCGVAGVMSKVTSAIMIVFKGASVMNLNESQATGTDFRDRR